MAYERGIVVHECCADSCSWVSFDSSCASCFGRSKDQVLHMSWVPQTCCTQDDRFVPNSKYSKVGTSLLVIPWDVHGELLNAGLTISHHPLAVRHVEVIPRSGQADTNLLSAFHCQLPIRWCQPKRSEVLRSVLLNGCPCSTITWL